MGKDCVKETEDCVTAGTEETNGRDPSAEVCVTEIEIGVEDCVTDAEHCVTEPDGCVTDVGDCVTEPDDCVTDVEEFVTGDGMEEDSSCSKLSTMLPKPVGTTSNCANSSWLSSSFVFKDVRANCLCAFLVHK